MGGASVVLRLKLLASACGLCCCRNQFDAGVPFGGYKASGIGREKGQSALEHYTQVNHTSTVLAMDTTAATSLNPQCTVHAVVLS